MYTPIENEADIEAYAKERSRKPLLDQTYSILLRLLTAVVWTSGLLFAGFTLFHYVKRAIIGEISTAWDSSDPGLYRKHHPAANATMLLHFLGGIVLMVLGPIQLIPAIRRNYIDLHRITGRIYIVAALVAAIGATAFVVFYGTSRGDRWEDAGNIGFGSLVILCACQSYRHVKYTHNIPLHKLWSWRLFAVVLGALLYRLYVVVYFAFVLFTPWQGNAFLYNALYFLFYLPNLLVVEVIWRRHQQQEQRKTVLETSLLLLCIVYVTVTTLAIFTLSWLPAIRGQTQTSQSEALLRNGKG